MSGVKTYAGYPHPPAHYTNVASPCIQSLYPTDPRSGGGKIASDVKYLPHNYPSGVNHSPNQNIIPRHVIQGQLVQGFPVHYTHSQCDNRVPMPTVMYPIEAKLSPLGSRYHNPTLPSIYDSIYNSLDCHHPGYRKNVTKETTAPLKSWLMDHRKNPYPTKAEKIMLAIITKMTLTQVSTWFANARRRLKKETGSDCDDEDGEQSEGQRSPVLNSPCEIDRADLCDSYSNRDTVDQANTASNSSCTNNNDDRVTTDPKRVDSNPENRDLNNPDPLDSDPDATDDMYVCVDDISDDEDDDTIKHHSPNNHVTERYHSNDVTNKCRNGYVRNMHTETEYVRNNYSRTDVGDRHNLSPNPRINDVRDISPNHTSPNFMYQPSIKVPVFKSNSTFNSNDKLYSSYDFKRDDTLNCERSSAKTIDKQFDDLSADNNKVINKSAVGKLPQESHSPKSGIWSISNILGI